MHRAEGGCKRHRLVGRELRVGEQLLLELIRYRGGGAVLEGRARSWLRLAFEGSKDQHRVAIGSFGLILAHGVARPAFTTRIARKSGSNRLRGRSSSMCISLASMTDVASNELALRRLEQRRSDAMEQCDVSALDEVLAADFRLVHGDGTLDDKAGAIEAALRIPRRVVVPRELSIRLFGETALLTGPMTLARHHRRSGENRASFHQPGRSLRARTLAVRLVAGHPERALIRSCASFYR
jgi:uncharacterized protein DUF4440